MTNRFIPLMLAIAIFGCNPAETTPISRASNTQNGLHKWKPEARSRCPPRTVRLRLATSDSRLLTVGKQEHD